MSIKKNIKRTKTYLATILNVTEAETLRTKAVLEHMFGWVVLRGRNTDRKAVLGPRWRSRTQNDIPWRKAEYIDIYLHPKNPNYWSVNRGEGIKRQNLN